MVQGERLTENGNIVAGLRIERDDAGLIWVATKFTEGIDERDFCYLVLLPDAHVLTKQLIRYEHYSNCSIPDGEDTGKNLDHP